MAEERERELPAHLQKSLDNTKVEYRRLGDSGLRVSVPIFGCVSLGDRRVLPWVLQGEEAMALLKAAYDRGVNTWDTANAYCNGASEVLVGKTLQRHNIPRRKVVILTKCFFAVGEDPEISHYSQRAAVEASKDYQNNFGLSRAAIFHQVEASLRRLNTGYIDLLQIHRFDYDTPIEETMSALHHVVSAGKVRYIGAGSMWATQFARMQAVAEKNGWTKFISMQNQYNLLYREEEREMHRFCNDTGVGLIPWAPLAKGRLERVPDDFRVIGGMSTGGERDGGNGQMDVDRQIIARVLEIAQRHEWTLTQVALAWINKRVCSPVIGPASLERLEQAIAAGDKALTAEEEQYLEELYRPKAVDGHI